MDLEKMTAELESGGEPQTEAPVEQAPAPQETGIEYYLGEKQSRLPETAEFAFKHNGQLARVPANKLINNYRQTAHLEAKLQEMKEKFKPYEEKIGDLSAWEKKQQALEKYRQIQEWSEKNPDQWNRIWNGYEKAQNGLLPEGESQAFNSDALNQTISELRQQIQDLSSWKEERSRAEEDAKLQEAISQIEQEAKSFAEKYQKFGIDLDEVDEDGVTLKGRILKFGADNGLGRFEVAALSYLNDTLLERATAMGRQEGVKGAKGDVAAGILSRSGVPPVDKGQTQPDIRKMDENQRREAALAELIGA